MALPDIVLRHGTLIIIIISISQCTGTFIYRPNNFGLFSLSLQSRIADLDDKG
jgi:hypothetical protein